MRTTPPHMADEDDRKHFMLSFGEIACENPRARRMNLTTYPQNVTCDDCNSLIHRVIADAVKDLKGATYVAKVPMRNATITTR